MQIILLGILLCKQNRTHRQTSSWSSLCPHDYYRHHSLWAITRFLLVHSSREQPNGMDKETSHTRTPCLRLITMTHGVCLLSAPSDIAEGKKKKRWGNNELPLSSTKLFCPGATSFLPFLNSLSVLLRLGGPDDNNCYSLTQLPRDECDYCSRGERHRDLLWRCRKLRGIPAVHQRWEKSITRRRNLVARPSASQTIQRW